MKRLLLLLILSPVTLLGQVRQKAMVDSIKAAGTDVRRASTLISNTPGTKVEGIHVSDSDGYVTMVVRVHVAEAVVIEALQPLSIVKIKTGDIVADGASAVTVPTLFIIEKDEINVLLLSAFSKFKTRDIPVVTMDTTEVPFLLIIKPDMADLPLRSFAKFKIDSIVFGTVETASVPFLVYIRPEFEELPIHVVSEFRIESIVSKAKIAAIPVLPDIEPVTMEELSLVEPTELPVKHIPVSRMYTVVVPVFEEKRIPVEEMHLSDEGYDLLEKMEGFSPELYSLKDGGFTIGFGFFVPYGEAGKWSKGLTIEAAERIMRQKMPAYEDQVKQYINVPLTQEEFDALTMLAYNLGGFSKATSIVRDINEDVDFEQLQKDWMRFVHSKAPGVMKGLMNRRKDEIHVRSELNYQLERKIQVLKK